MRSVLVWQPKLRALCGTENALMHPKTVSGGIVFGCNRICLGYGRSGPRGVASDRKHTACVFNQPLAATKPSTRRGLLFAEKRNGATSRRRAARLFGECASVSSFAT